MVTTTTGIATEFIQFSRASNATVTDSDGKVKWAPHNLLTNSESFDAAAWTKTTVTPTANSIAAPNGTTTADTLAASGANGTALQTFTAEAISYTFGVWLKRKTGTGNIQIAADSGTYTTVTITSDWALYTVTQTPAAGSKSAGIRIVTSADEVYAWGAHLYRSDLGGMQPNTSAYPMYNPTTPKNLLGYTESLTTGWTGTNGGLQASGSELVTNGTFNTDISGWFSSLSAVLSYDSGAIRVTSGGVQYGKANQVIATVPGRLYRISFTAIPGTVNCSFAVGTTQDGYGLVSAQNLTANTWSYRFVATTTTTYIGFQNDSSTAGVYCSFDNISVQEIPSYEAPNALQTARAVDATSANGTLLSSISLLASPYTFSIWLKRKTGSGDVQLTVDGTTYVTVAVTGTWTRFSTTLTPTAGTKTPGIRLVTSGDAVYAWGAQLSDSASLDPYVPVYGAAVTSAAYYGPRRDFDGATLACKGLLVEEQRSNFLTYSSEFNNAAWDKTTPGTNITISANATTAPDGTSTADLAYPTASGATCYTNQLPNQTGIFSISVYAKASGKNVVWLYLRSSAESGIAYFDLSDQTTQVVAGSVSTFTATISPVGNGWYRLTATASASLAITSTAGAGMGICDAKGSLTITKSGTDGVYLWGAQLEAGFFATSYIPTGAATATRLADVASVSTQAFPYSATEGTLVANGVFSTAGRYVGLYNTSANQIEIYQNNSTSVIGFVYASGATQASISATANAFAVNKIALAFKENDVALSANGGTVVTDNTAVIPVATSLTLNAYVTSVLGSGWIRQITYLPRRISNTELQTRTA